MVAEFQGGFPPLGWIVAEEAEVGFTEDRFGYSPFDSPGCQQTFTNGTYGGLWAHMTCLEETAIPRGVESGKARTARLTVAPLDISVDELNQIEGMQLEAEAR